MALEELSNKYNVTRKRQVILLTEVTRMSGDTVCVAGIDIFDGKMVRPLQGDGSNWEGSRWVNHLGCMIVGNVLSLKSATAIPSQFPHATEDFRVSELDLLGSEPTMLYDACLEMADEDIESIFDGHLIEEKYVLAASACRSLGCVMVARNKLRVANWYGKVQVSFQDRYGTWNNLPVTELRTKNAGGTDDGVKSLISRLSDVGLFTPVALRLGLARAWVGPEGNYDPKRCYLQLNGLILPR